MFFLLWCWYPHVLHQAILDLHNQRSDACFCGKDQSHHKHTQRIMYSFLPIFHMQYQRRNMNISSSRTQTKNDSSWDSHGANSQPALPHSLINLSLTWAQSDSRVEHRNAKVWVQQEDNVVYSMESLITGTSKHLLHEQV